MSRQRIIIERNQRVYVWVADKQQIGLIPGRQSFKAIKVFATYGGDGVHILAEVVRDREGELFKTDVRQVEVFSDGEQLTVRRDDVKNLSLPAQESPAIAIAVADHELRGRGYICLQDLYVTKSVEMSLEEMNQKAHELYQAWKQQESRAK